ncbi:MAG: MATE family efflux transporter, partial [Verrucomicrobiota bacterium]
MFKDPIPAATLPTRPWPTFGGECRQTVALAFPLMAGQLGQMLMGVIDTVMVGRLGAVPLGAAAFVGTLLSVPYVLGIGLLVSISVRVSQARGAQQPEEARNALRHGTWLALLFGLGIVAVSAALLPFLSLFHQPAEVTAAAPRFLMIMALSMVPAMLSLAWKNHADAMDHPWPSFWFLLGGVALNVVFNWLLIYGNAGFPALGLEGAAISTFIARTLLALAMFLWLSNSIKLRHWTPRLWSGWFKPLRKELFAKLLVIGIPSSMQLLSEVLAFAGAGLVIGTLGTVPLAAHQIAITCASTAFMVPLGVAMAMTVRVGNIVGADERPRLPRVLLGGWVFAIGLMACTMLVFWFGGLGIARMFVGDPDVVKLAASLLGVAGIFQLFDGIQVVSGGALRGVNDVRFPAMLTLISYCAVALPLGAVLCLLFQWG